MSGDGIGLSKLPYPPTSFLGLLGGNSSGDSLRCHALRGPIQHWGFADFAGTTFV